jgi:hypothetical protein
MRELFNQGELSTITACYVVKTGISHTGSTLSLPKFNSVGMLEMQSDVRLVAVGTTTYA